jgi:hypothetical protein
MILVFVKFLKIVFELLRKYRLNKGKLFNYPITKFFTKIETKPSKSEKIKF